MGYGPQGRKELDMTEVNVTHTYTHTPHFDVREYTVLKLLALGKLGGILVFFFHINSVLSSRLCNKKHVTSLLCSEQLC